MTIQERTSCLILNYTRKPNEREKSSEHNGLENTKKDVVEERKSK